MKPTPPSNHQHHEHADEAPSGFFRLNADGTLVRVEDGPPPAVRDWTHEREAWTVSQIAEAMSRKGVVVGVSTVRGWCEAGLLPASKTSARGHWRITGRDLRTFVNGDAAALAA